WPPPGVGRDKLPLTEGDDPAPDQAGEPGDQPRIDLRALAEREDRDPGGLDLTRDPARPEAAHHRLERLAIEPLDQLQDLLLRASDIELVDDEEHPGGFRHALGRPSI